MGWLRKAKGSLFCSFCRKSDHEVNRLIGGPGVYICGGCVETCLKILKLHQGKKVPDFGGWDSYTDSQLLQSLAPTEKTLEAVRGDLQSKIDMLRKRGMSWETIGGALSISRQAAWERFS
ncbi:MAG TPA: ClpX C4-type zinc finger protein [Candidatus Angelobacter sp.]|nr:ClpX C4-type zinc finger protein [Candidatus Angelobacter sp.]